jgi:diacylglycerol O-acyltransferase / wax synthase
MAAPDRLTPLDASFLHLEDASAPMHVAAALVFEGPVPRYEELLDHMAARLHLVPRYRHRLAEVPLGQGRPLWVDDERFDLRFHVRATALPRPGTERELQVLAGRVFSQPLRRDRPLWETWLVEGLEGGRFALLSKTHHAVVDGISGLDVLAVLFAPEGDTDGAADAWTPQPAPSPARRLAEALAGRAVGVREVARPLLDVVGHPRRLVERATQTAAGVAAFAQAGLRPAPRSPYNARMIGPDRRFTWVRASLDEIKAVKNELGGTVNDVALTVVARALRSHLLRRGEEVDGLELKAFVPVSLRSDDERTGQGNLVSGMVALLPVGSPDAVTCLRTIHDHIEGTKRSGQTSGAVTLTDLTAFPPPAVVAQAAKAITRQRFINLVITNVPGPQFPLYMAGRELLDIFPMVPLGRNLGLGIAIASYNGTMNFGLVGDFQLLHDLDDLAGDIEAALDELRGAAQPAAAGSSARAAATA